MSPGSGGAYPARRPQGAATARARTDDPNRDSLRSLRPLATGVAGAVGLSSALLAAGAAAQSRPLPDNDVVGSWTFRPTVEVRVRGEYRRHPVDVGGDVYSPTAVLYEDTGSTLPRVTSTQPAVRDQYFVAERARLGLAVDRGPVTAAVTLQDARVWGDQTLGSVAPSEPSLPSFAPYEAYLDVHTQGGRRVFLRVGRQKVSWGDGRLLGANDWSSTGRSLDAARFGFQVGDFDVELLASMLAAPGRYGTAATVATTAGGTGTPPMVTLTEGSGAQLYGVDAVWHALPCSTSRSPAWPASSANPTPTTLTPSDTYVVDGRISGDRRGFRYAVEAAYELGRVAPSATSATSAPSPSPPASASRPRSRAPHLRRRGRLRDRRQGRRQGHRRRFDPILPDEHTPLSPMSLFAWSNILPAGGTVGLHPLDELGLLAGYRYAALAQPEGRWTTAAPRARRRRDHQRRPLPRPRDRRRRENHAVARLRGIDAIHIWNSS